MRSVFAIIVISLIAGCTRPMYISSIKTNEEYRPGIVSKNIKTYLTGKIPEYEEIGLIQIVLSNFRYDLIDRIVEEASVKAVEMGADCIILINNSVLKDQNTSFHMTDDGVPITMESIGQYPKYVFIAGRLKK
jgi:hypothetical protein